MYEMRMIQYHVRSTYACDETGEGGCGGDVDFFWGCGGGNKRKFQEIDEEKIIIFCDVFVESTTNLTVRTYRIVRKKNQRRGIDSLRFGGGAVVRR